MQKQLRVIFAGRFQPFHTGHLAVYKHLCDMFGNDNAYIASSNKQGPNSPLNFEQKKHIACTFFNIPTDKFVPCRIPYVPYEILTDKINTVSIICLGKKDRDRLTNSKHYELLPDVYNLDTLKTSDIVSYIYHSPMFEDSRSASSIRDKFRNKLLTFNEKKQYFVELFGVFDNDIYSALNR